MNMSIGERTIDLLRQFIRLPDTRIRRAT